MVFSNTYSYRERSIFDVNTLMQALRLIIVNAILGFIFLFLTLEDIEWTLFSFREKNNDVIIDNTSWNIKTIF